MKTPGRSPLTLAAFAAFACTSTAPALAGEPVACADLTKLTIPTIAMTIRQASVVPQGPIPAIPPAPAEPGTLPPHCRADGVIDEREGRNGKRYAIGFAIALPEKWNGRFFFQGGGGLNGSVRPPIGASTGGPPALARGFAVVSTDSGHQSAAVFDASFFEDQEATLNFLYKAVEKVTVAAKEIVKAHYGRAPDRSYFVGCSTGGREAMLMSQRYPTHFDGIVAGAPAMRTSYSNLADRWVATSLNKVAPRDANGRPDAARALSESDRKLFIDSLLKACDADDGLADGMIFAPQSCRFDPLSIACEGPKTDACLSPEQARAIRDGFAGPKDSRGLPVYPGFWYDTGITATRGIPGLLNPGPSPVGPPNIATEMNVDAEAARAATPVAALGDSAAWTQLDTFSGRGGKLIFYHGVSDPWFSAQDTVQYYERLVKDNGGADAVSRWSRLFLVPGMGHCAGGDATLDRFELIEPLVRWVEHGEAPETLIATGTAFPNRSRPLCPYPAHAHYKGQDERKGNGDRESAASFECRVSD